MFVSCEAMQGWWNQGVHEKSLNTYRFLVQDSITARFLGLALISRWQVNIIEILRSMPTIPGRLRMLSLTP
jgi:hypothetical protein